METAKQVVVHRFGGPEVLELIDSPIPTAHAGEILVRVEAAGVLYGDIMRRTDRYLLPSVLPYWPGTEIAGTVVDVGENATKFTVGDRVVCRVASGGYAQYAIAKEVASSHLPDEIGFADATALLAQGLTAYLLSHNTVDLHGKAVFIESIAGGVGSQMMQMARALGAKFIVGSASTPDKREHALRLGADFMVSSVEINWADSVNQATGGRGLDVAFESSGTSFVELLKCLAPFGTLVKFGRGVTEHQAHDPSTLLEKNQTIRGFYLPGYFGQDHQNLVSSATNTLIRSAVDGDLTIRVSQRFGLKDVQLAHSAIEQRKTTGKVVLSPWA